MDEIEQHDDIQVFLGVDVGKGDHHAVALDRTRTRSSRECRLSRFCNATADPNECLFRVESASSPEQTEV